MCKTVGLVFEIKGDYSVDLGTFPFGDEVFIKGVYEKA